MNRSVVLDIFVSDNGLRKKVIESIRLFRAACRKAYSACAMAEMAGADIVIGDDDVKIKPHGDAAKAILENAFNIHDKKAHLYQLRRWLRELHPSWMSIVPEAIHIMVSQRWRAPDTEFPKAKRGYLTLCGARKFAEFQRAGIVIKNTIPKLLDRKIACKWDSEIGEVEFTIGKVDASRYYIWSNIRDEKSGWKLGTIYLKYDEDDHKLVAVMTYTCPDLDKTLDPDKPVFVEFSDSPENFITCHTDDKFSGEVISAVGAIDYLKEMECIYSRYTKQLASYDRRLAVKHRKKIRERIHRYAIRRENGVKDHNHLWTRRIAQFAERKCAGNIVVINMPNETIHVGDVDYPWQWFQFKNFLKYKIEQIGGTVKFATAEEAVAA